MSEEVLRIWLRNEASWTAFERLAHSRGWMLIADEVRSHSNPTQHVFRTVEGTDVGWHEDHPLGVRHLWISGPGADVARRDLETVLSHWTRAELLAGLKERDRLDLLSRVRVLSCMERQDLSNELKAILVGLMSHSNKIVRRVALHLCWANAWPNMLDVIQSQAEKDEELAEEWQRLAEVLEEAQAKES